MVKKLQSHQDTKLKNGERKAEEKRKGGTLSLPR
jgi:hypothetical protein